MASVFGMPVDDDQEADESLQNAVKTPGVAEKQRAAVLAEVQADGKLDHALAAAALASSASSAPGLTVASSKPTTGAAVAPAESSAPKRKSRFGAATTPRTSGLGTASSGVPSIKKPQTVEEILAAKASMVQAQLETAQKIASLKVSSS